jgi:hypothetical protein
MTEPPVSLPGRFMPQEVRSIYLFLFDMGSPVSATDDSNLKAHCSARCDLRHTHETKVLRLARRIDHLLQRKETETARQPNNSPALPTTSAPTPRRASLRRQSRIGCSLASAHQVRTPPAAHALRDTDL